MTDHRGTTTQRAGWGSGALRLARAGAARAAAGAARGAAVGAAIVALSGCLAEGPGEGTDPRSVVGAEGAVEFTVTPLAPPAEGPNDFRVELRGLVSGAPIGGAALAVSAVMPSMGHEATSEPGVEELEPGVYEVTDVVFSMSGIWHVRYRAEAPVQDEAAFEYEVR